MDVDKMNFSTTVDKIRDISYLYTNLNGIILPTIENKNQI